MDTTMNKSWRKAYIAFMIWVAMCLTASLANVVIWLIKPYSGFAYHDMPNWMIVYYAPGFTVFVMPSIAIILLVRFFPLYRWPWRLFGLFAPLAVLTWCLHSIVNDAQWLYLPDIYDYAEIFPYREGDIATPGANYTLAWGAMCGLLIAVICLAEALRARQELRCD